MKVFPKIPTVYFMLIALSFYALFCTTPNDNSGNNNGGGQTQKNSDSRSLCGSAIPKDSLAEILDGDMVAVAPYLSQGISLQRIAADLIIGMALNGVNFDALNTYQLSYSSGTYSYVSGMKSINLRFFFAQDFGSFHAGDIIPYNLFSIGSYLTDISVGLNGITYNEGPLYNLIEGNISFNNLTPKIALKTTLVSFTIQSTSLTLDTAGTSVDSFFISMTTLPATIQTFTEQVNAEGFGFSYDSTFFISKKYNLDETIYGSTFYMRKNDTTWFWDGYYSGDVRKENFHFYLRGLASNLQQNYTGYYCDAAFADSFGVAIHDRSLLFGHFYSVFGDTLFYLLE
ncbi:MAG: hypothetical protein KGJ59_13135 [Bacteroidota bacterium]|nr:hypothetical protein [Bacteroidota bacterium]